MWALVTYNIVVVYLGFGSTGIDYSNFNQVSVLVMTGINLGVYYFIIFMHVPTHCKFVCRIWKDQISYLTWQGAYAQTMVANAFCNVDDVSWGTKGSTAAHGGGKKYETEKVFFVSSWYLSFYLGSSTTVCWPTSWSTWTWWCLSLALVPRITAG